MSLALRTTVRPPHVQVERAAPGALMGRALSVAVADGRAFVLVQSTPGERPNDLYEFDLRGGPCEFRLVVRDVEAFNVLGVLGGEPVVAYWLTAGAHSTFRTFRATRREEAIVVAGDPIVSNQTRSAIWLLKTQAGQACRLELVDDRLTVIRSDGPVFTDALLYVDEMSNATLRLPMACKSTITVMAVTMARIGARNKATGRRWLVDFVNGTPTHISYSAELGVIDGATGAVLWIESNSLRVLHGAMCPALAWTPASHAAHTPAERSRALALLFCLLQINGRAFPPRLAQLVIARCLA